METYLQTTDYTTAACSLMLILNHFTEFEVCRENEFDIWMASANLPTRACSIYGLANYAHDEGLEPEIILEEKEYDYPGFRLEGYTKKEIDEAKFTSKLHHKRARDRDIPIHERSIAFRDVKEAVRDDAVLLLRVNAGALRDDEDSVSNYVVVHTYRDEFSMVDPVQGKIRVGEDNLKRAFETLVTEKQRDHRMIVF